jgi:hypothetical protein
LLTKIQYRQKTKQAKKEKNAYKRPKKMFFVKKFDVISLKIPQNDDEN